MPAQDKYPPYKVTPGTSMLADVATRGFQTAVLFVAGVGAATIGAGIVQGGSTLVILVGLGIALAGGALIWIAHRARRGHEDAIAQAVARRQAKQARKDSGTE